MSRQVSNLYAARVFSEHPIALWALDDDFSYISRISSSEKDILNWNLYNLDAISGFTEPLNLPLQNEQTSGISIVSASVELYGSASAEAINSFTDIDPNKKTISINAFAYDYQGFVNNYEIGFIVSGSTFVTEHVGKGLEVWQKISHTMNIPSENVDIYPYIKINYDSPGVNSGEEFDIAIHGISVGQWSEEFHYQNTGIFTSPIPDSTLLSILSASSSLPSSDIKYVSADAYGISDSQNGYYLVEKNRMLSTNSNFPVTFGATNITTLKHPLSGDIPSLVFPGYGFLNESGKYNQITAEFWLKAYTNSLTSTKIFGPITTQDGLYIDKDFLTLKIGRYIKSYFLGKIYRPMLIHIRHDVSLVSILINGDLVIELQVDQNRLNFSDFDKDYLGFYTKSYIYPFNIDSFAIYPYIVQEQIAKKRYIYAQGVESADNISSNFKADSFNVDFSFANYTTSLNYPDMNDWNSGYFNNLNANSNSLSLPTLQQPEIIFSEELDIEDFLDDNLLIQDSETHPFIRLKPNSNYENIDASIYFKNLQLLSSPVKSIIAVYESPSTLLEEEETVLFFTNNIDNNKFYTTISNAGVKYYFNNQLLFSHELSPSQIFTVGFDLDRLSNNFVSEIGNFFANPQNLSLRVGGCPITTCTGKIFDIHFNNKLFTDNDVSNFILDNGIIDPDLGPEEFFDYVGNYTWHPQKLFDSFILSVGSKGYWEDSIPLSYFGKPIQNISGKVYYDLDLMQFNINSHSNIATEQVESDFTVLDGGSPSLEFYDFFFDGGLPSSSFFDLLFDGGFPETINFDEELTEGQIEAALYYLGESRLKRRAKVYVTLQHYTEVGKIPYTNYINVNSLDPVKILDFDNISNYKNTKFYIDDGTIIFPPKELVDFSEYYITFHIELQTESIDVDPVKIRKMSISSLAYDETDFYKINSPNGYKLYPFSRYGQTYSYKDKNPVVIYKDSTSYMYMTSDSGVSVLPYTSSATRGFTIPINQQLSEEYLLGGIQVWLMYNKKSTIDQSIKLGSVYTPTLGYDAWIIPESNNLRARLVLYDKDTTNLATGIVFYQNGNIVDNPYITPLQWSSVVITFDESIVLNSSVAQFEIYEGFLINNVAFYKKSSDILGSTVVDKTWQELRSESTWGTWFDSSSVWSQVADKIVATTFTVDGKAIYNSTFGISSTVSSDNSILSVNSDGVTIVSDSIWNQYSAKPV